MVKKIVTAAKKSKSHYEFRLKNQIVKIGKWRKLLIDSSAVCKFLPLFEIKKNVYCILSCLLYCGGFLEKIVHNGKKNCHRHQE